LSTLSSDLERLKTGAVECLLFRRMSGSSTEENSLSKLVAIALASALLCACSSVDSSQLVLHDSVQTAATDLRWKRQSESMVAVKLRYSTPVVVLALPPGAYSAQTLEGFMPSAEGKDWLKKRLKGQPLNSTQPELYVLGSRGSEQSFFDEALSIPKPIGLWKQGDTRLEISLKREGDEVQIIALR
jgi:hypothetical protein